MPSTGVIPRQVKDGEVTRMTAASPCLWLLFVALSAFALLARPAAADYQPAEHLGRGLVALPTESGVFLSWRLLAQDPEAVAFRVSRRMGANGRFERLTAQPLTDVTNYQDEQAPAGEVSYRVEALAGGRRLGAPATVTVRAGEPQPYLRIPLAGDYRPHKVCLGDLDGDGELELVIQQPNFNTDPYQQPGYWKVSPTTYKLEAYKLDGRMLWRYDMGWAIEAGTWYAPYTVFDLDGDGRAEVYCKAGEGDPREPTGHVRTGPEYVVKLDGNTGKVVARTEWLSRDGFEDYNYFCRNFLAIAYCDGKRPSLIMERGTYSIIKVAALSADLRQQWYWESTGESSSYRGQGAHTLQAADVDGDGKDELVIGSACLDHDGTPLWCTGLGHPDALYVTNIDPSRPGLEIFYGIEPPHESKAVCLADARTGEILWYFDGPTSHVHGQGMCADIIAEKPGLECYAGEQNGSQYWLYSAKGELLSQEKLGGLAPVVAWWDGDEQKEILLDHALRHYHGEPITRIEGSVLAVADLLGDWREELITAVDGELRIYTTTLPAATRKVTLLQNHHYRMGLATQGTGYWCPPQLGP
jgi:rhamnogalacturonan endolyase